MGQHGTNPFGAKTVCLNTHTANLCLHCFHFEMLAGNVKPISPVLDHSGHWCKGHHAGVGAVPQFVRWALLTL